jgi:hypothetical protein
MKRALTLFGTWVVATSLTASCGGSSGDAGGTPANNSNPVGFATVRDCPNPPSQTGCDATDTLIEVDLALLGAATTGSVTKSVRGQVVKAAGCNDTTTTSYGQLFGIAAWQSDVIGFSHTGAIVRVSNVDGTGCMILSTAADVWAGAGVTTLAPVLPPPP